MANLRTVSNKDPKPFYLDAPQGYEKSIQALQSLLSENISWLNQKVFGRAFNIRKEDTDKALRPYAYMGENKDYYELIPNDSLGAFGFFFPLEQARAFDYNNFSKTNRFERRTALVIWGNKNKVLGKDEEYQTEKINQQILNVIKLSGDVDELEVVGDDNIRNVFEPYSIEEFKRQLFNPYFGLRYEFTLVYSEGECETSYTRLKPLKSFTAEYLFNNLTQEQLDELKILLNQ